MLNIQQIKRKRINKNIKKQMLGDKESKVVIKKEIKKFIVLNDEKTKSDCL